MSSYIKNHIAIIVGLPGGGKTLWSLVLASQYKENGGKVFSNTDFTYNGKKFNQTIKNIGDLDLIGFQKNKGLVILDEAGLNINSRRSSSGENLEYAKLPMLGRKKNIDIVVIAQLDYTIDKYFRDLSSCIFDMSSYPVKGGKLMFEVDVLKRVKGSNNKIYHTTHKIDMIEYMRVTGYGYNTLEESLIKKDLTD